jgi:hypothetical protein
LDHIILRSEIHKFVHVSCLFLSDGSFYVLNWLRLWFNKMSFFERMKVAVKDDPLANRSSRTDSCSSTSSATPIRPSESTRVKTESLTIRLTDELRIVGAMADAAKKKTSGVIFTVRIDTSKSASLCIGVKDLQDKLLAISMLKRVNGVPGPVEQAGVRLGDIVFGINFQPCREGSRTLLQTVKREKERKRHTIHLQVGMHAYLRGCTALASHAISVCLLFVVRVVLAVQTAVLGQRTWCSVPARGRDAGAGLLDVPDQGLLRLGALELRRDPARVS